MLALYFENSYRVLVRYFFNFFQGDKIKFVGKNFHVFASPSLVVSFGLFSVLFTLLLRGQSNKSRFVYPTLTIILFFVTTTATTYIDSLGKVAECTACQDGVRSLHYNAVNYDFHFITSLVVGLLPLLWTFVRKQISNRRKKRLPTTCSLPQACIVLAPDNSGQASPINKIILVVLQRSSFGAARPEVSFDSPACGKPRTLAVMPYHFNQICIHTIWFGHYS